MLRRASINTDRMFWNNLRKSIRIKIIFILLRLLLCMPLRVREIGIILLSVVSNPLLRTIKICGYSVQQMVNLVSILLTYYLGVGLSALWSRIMRADYLLLQDRNRKSFWSTKVWDVEETENLKRQF